MAADALNNIKKMVTALITPFATLETALLALLTQRSVDTAIGAQLDVLGKIVGEVRNGLDDDDYRRYVRARVLANRSQGVSEDLIKIAVFILGVTTPGTIFIHTVSDASLILEIFNVAVTTAEAIALQDMLQDAVSAGVRLVISYPAVVNTGVFRLDSGPGLDVGHLNRGIDSTGTP